MQQLMDANHVDLALQHLVDLIRADASLRSHPSEGLALVGIRSRGELLAQRIARALRSHDAPSPLDVGALDITMYRDDLDSRRRILIPQGTDMNFRLDGRAVVLVDDVLETGRTIRAALDAVVDFGRPRLMRLAVLVDRGMREFPIAADYVGMHIGDGEGGGQIVVHLRPTDQDDGVYLQQRGEVPP